MKKITVFLVLALLAAMFAVSAFATETFTNPVGPFADPFVLKEGDTYYLYGTGGTGGFPVYSSTNLVEWTAHGYCLMREDIPYDENSEYSNAFWAPEVKKYGDLYYMIYTAQHRLGVAVSDSPLGPFVDNADGYLIPDVNTIDGHLFEDGGKMYLYFATERAAGDTVERYLNGTLVPVGNNIWGCEFDMDTLTIKEDTLKLVIPWDSAVETSAKKVEGPYMLKHNGTYYLTFSSGGYWTQYYAVRYATSNSPLGDFVRYDGDALLGCDDLGREDTDNPHLYGPGHHSFTTSPDGKERIIVYHAHRTGYSANEEELSETIENPLVNPRSTCIDLAWFDEDGVLHAGRNGEGVPSATEQVLPSGATLKRGEPQYTGAFADIATLPTVYVAYYDGVDTNDGSKDAPLRTLEQAYSMLESGGTIVLTQNYTIEYFDAPAVNGPMVITAEHSNVRFAYKFISVNSDTYFDNIIFAPQTANGISVIECNFNDVVMGEGVSCLNRPAKREFPYLVGGKWWFTGTTTTTTYEIYKNFIYESTDEVTTDAAYSLTVLGGTWEQIIAESMKGKKAFADSAVNASLTVGEGVVTRPGTAGAPALKNTGNGTVVTYEPIDGVSKYQIFRDGELIGYSESTTFVDSERVLGGSNTYTVRGYANGCCIGAESLGTVITTYGDMDGDEILEFSDVLSLISTMVDGTSEATLVDVLIAFKALVK